MRFGNSGKTIRSATLTLTRLAGYGVSGDVDVILWGTKVTGRSGRATSGAVSYGSIGAIGNGETKVFSVPVEAITALINGTMGGLMLQSEGGQGLQPELRHVRRSRGGERAETDDHLSVIISSHYKMAR